MMTIKEVKCVCRTDYSPSMINFSVPAGAFGRMDFETYISFDPESDTCMIKAYADPVDASNTSCSDFSYSGEYKIDYCPFCGRKFEGEKR